MIVSSAVPVLLQTLVAAAIGAIVLAAYRRIRAQSRLVAGLFAAALLARAGAGLLLFWVSYLDAGWLAHLHGGDGFWELAIDARHYYSGAVRGATEGLASISGAEASAGYVRVLALWLIGVGLSPASGFFLNLVLYTLLAALLTGLFRPNGQWAHDAPCLATLGAFSFSPVLLVHSTQPLKDDLFAFLIAIGAAAGLMLLRHLCGGPVLPRGSRSLAAWLFVLLLVVYLLAGIRAYFAFLFWGSVALALVLSLPRAHGWRALRRLPAAAGLLLLLWVACLAGAGPYAEIALSPMRTAWYALVGPPPSGAGSRTLLALSEATSTIHSVREGFERTGGATNVTRWTFHDPSLESGLLGTLSRLALGLTLLVVPVSLLLALSLIEFEGGRGLLVITDMDTLFLYATLVVVGLIVRRQWSLVHQDAPYLLMLLVLTIVTTGLVAYVVTNFGTLFRLRLMLAVPLWMIPLALSGRTRAERLTAGELHGGAAKALRAS